MNWISESLYQIMFLIVSDNQLIIQSEMEKFGDKLIAVFELLESGDKVISLFNKILAETRRVVYMWSDSANETA